MAVYMASLIPTSNKTVNFGSKIILEPYIELDPIKSCTINQLFLKNYWAFRSE